MQKLLQWLDGNILFYLAALLLIFIPLYPKLPIIDIIPGYIVRIRVEDFLILFTLIVWIIQVARKKVSLTQNPLFKPISLYLIVGILSVLSAFFIIRTVPLEPLHMGKTFLHYLRRIEYFSLFFILFSAVRKPKDIKIFTFILIFAVLGVTIYGYGQKYLYWPAFSTMNREFSKGWLLYLTGNSRLLSTFGGHYDLAAYMMMMLTFLWSLFFGLKNKLAKAGVFILLAASFWTLILTASRTSFLAYIASVSIVVFLWIFRHSLTWFITRWIAVIALSMFVMISFGDLSERFAKLLRIEERFGGLKSVLLKPATNPPQDKAVFLVNNLQAVTSKSDQPPTPDKDQAKRPSDVIDDQLLPLPDSTDSSKIIYTQRSYSDSALQYDLSTGIRLDALWPMAINGFMKNPLLGSGYATLNKSQFTEFTEAESTDNDFLRMLGETGLLGTLAFLGTIFIANLYIWKALPGVKDNFTYAFLVSAMALSFGMLVNAIYIDVFEASKVAYTYWSIMGIALGTVYVQRKEIAKNKTPLKISFSIKEIIHSIVKGINSDKFIVILIIILAFYLRIYKIDNPVADWHSWRQADTASVTRHFLKTGINLLYPIYDDLSSIPSGLQNPKGYRMVEFPAYNAISVLVKKIIPEGPIERSMRLTSIFASLGSLIFIFRLVKKYVDRPTAIISALVFASIPYSIFYSRVILPEPFLVFLSLGTIYFFDSYATYTQTKGLKSTKYYLLTAVFGALSLLVKPFAVFLLLPIPYIALKNWGISIWKRMELYPLALVIILPFIFWRTWIQQFPEGIPAYDWLFNGDNIRFKGAFFYWLFAERVAKLILGYWGLFPLLIGIAAVPTKKEGWIFRLLLLGSIGYLFTIATGNVRHDYYQVLLVPAITIYVAKGIAYLIKTNQFPRITSTVLAVISVCFMLAFGWYQIRDFYNINHPEIVEAGNKVNEITPQKSLVIAPYGGDTAFLYQTQRSGWPIMEGSIDDMVKKGAHFYVTTNYDDLTNSLIKN